MEENGEHTLTYRGIVSITFLKPEYRFTLYVVLSASGVENV
jgi:hypothetical protein